MSVGEYQRLIAEKLRREFVPAPVEIEWRAMAVEQGLYCPRLDIAVGPFAVHDRYIAEYDEMAIRARPLLDALVRHFTDNVRVHTGEECGLSVDDVCERNRNARCFLAVEIENRGSRKHYMGGAVNAAALGRIGLVVAWNDDALRSLIRLRRYFLFLTGVEKNSFNVSNLIIVSSAQLSNCLDHGRDSGCDD